jgi:hypothetical protein
MAGCSTAAKIELDYSGQSEILSHETRGCCDSHKTLCSSSPLGNIYTFHISAVLWLQKTAIFFHSARSLGARGILCVPFYQRIISLRAAPVNIFSQKILLFLPAHSSMFKCSSLREKEKCCLRFLGLFCLFALYIYLIRLIMEFILWLHACFSSGCGLLASEGK